MTTQPLKTNEQYGEEGVRRSVATVAQQLRDLARRVEIEAGARADDAKRGTDSYGSVAGSVVHEVQWGVSNMNFDALIRYASDADIAHERGD